MWHYLQTTGELLHDDQHIAFGYSGAEGDGYNNPDMQDVHGKGPIPQGRWLIVGPPVDYPTHGPYVLHLEPAAGTNTFGRSGFLCHGDAVGRPGTASEGCIVMGRFVREQIWNSGDRDLIVTG